MLVEVKKKERSAEFDGPLLKNGSVLTWRPCKLPSHAFPPESSLGALWIDFGIDRTVGGVIAVFSKGDRVGSVT